MQDDIDIVKEIKSNENFASFWLDSGTCVCLSLYQSNQTKPKHKQTNKQTKQKTKKKKNLVLSFSKAFQKLSRAY